MDGVGVGSSMQGGYAGGTGFRVYDIRRGHYHTGHLRISLISIPLTLTTFMSMDVVYSKSRQLMASVPLSEDSLQRPGDLDFPALWGYLGVNLWHFWA